MESWRGNLGILIYFVFNPLLQIAWASGVPGTLFTIRKRSHDFKPAAADDIACTQCRRLVIDDTAEAADEERGNPESRPESLFRWNSTVRSNPHNIEGTVSEDKKKKRKKSGGHSAQGFNFKYKGKKTFRRTQIKLLFWEIRTVLAQNQRLKGQNITCIERQVLVGNGLVAMEQNGAVIMGQTNL